MVLKSFDMSQGDSEVRVVVTQQEGRDPLVGIETVSGEAVEIPDDFCFTATVDSRYERLIGYLYLLGYSNNDLYLR